MTIPLALIHGGNCRSACWSGVASRLGLGTLAVDLPGRGRRPADLADPAQVSLRVWADAVVGELDEAGIDRAYFVGHSLGGATLSSLALHHPDRVAGLAFVACPMPATGGCVGQACLPEIWSFFQAERDADRRVIAPPAREHAAALFGNDMDPAGIDRMCADLVPESLAVFFEPLDLSGLRRGVPTLYVKLLQDRASPPAVQDVAIAAVRPDRIATIDCGHMAMLTQPVALADTLTAWVRSLEERP